MVDVVTFKWRRSRVGYQLPQCCEYTARHVNNLHSMARRQGKFDRFILVTDDPDGVDPGIEIIPLWDDYAALGGCFNRLKMYDMGWPKFLMIDLDCVIVGSIQHLLDRPEDLVLNRYMLPRSPRQYYNGALQLVGPGNEKVWRKFTPGIMADLMRYRGTPRGLVGTDQAWLSYYLGPGVPTFSPADGVYDIKDCQRGLPDNASIVFFHGAQDPSVSDLRWVRRHWC